MMIDYEKSITHKFLYGTISAVLVIICVVMNYFYRPYIFSNHINDYHLAECYTSLLGVPILMCFMQAYLDGKYSIPYCICFSTCYLIAWELVTPIFGLFSNTLDWVDITACIISGTLCYVLYLIWGYKGFKNRDRQLID